MCMSNYEAPSRVCVHCLRVVNIGDMPRYLRNLFEILCWDHVWDTRVSSETCMGTWQGANTCKNLIRGSNYNIWIL